MNSNWNLYRIFYYVAFYGTTAAASRELFIAQPSVSLSIKRLEEQLKCELFVRSHKGMELTKNGKLLYDNVSVAFKAIEKAEDSIAKAAHTGLRTVDVAGIDTTIQFFLHPYLKLFKEQEPDTTVELHQCVGIWDAEAMMDAGVADFSVMQVPSARQEYISAPVKEVLDVLVCDEKYAGSFAGGKLSVSELADYKMITHLKGVASRELIDGYFSDNGVSIVPEYEYSHVSSILRQMKQSFSLAFVLEEIVRDELSSGRIRRIELDPPLPHRFYYLIAPREPRSQEAGRLRDFLMTEAALAADKKAIHIPNKK